MDFLVSGILSLLVLLSIVGGTYLTRRYAADDPPPKPSR